MTIRNATLKDIDLICDIENQLFLPEEGRFSRRVLIYHLHKGGRVFVALDNDEVVGYLLVLSYLKSLRIYSIAILSHSQGKGYGKFLCDYVIDLAKKQKKDFVSLEVRLSNQKAISLYKKLGFLPQKILSHYYGNEDGLKMKKQINH